MKIDTKVLLRIVGVVFGLFLIRYLVSFLAINYGFFVGSKAREVWEVKSNYGAGETVFSLEHMWLRWDATVYRDIASKGYEWLPEAYFKTSRHGWFPLYSLATGVISYLLPFPDINKTVFYVGVLVSNVSLVFALYFLNAICDILGLSKRNKLMFFGLFLAYPWNFFYSTLYSESFYLLLTVLIVYFLLKKEYLYSVICSGLALVTRPPAASYALLVLAWILNEDYSKKVYKSAEGILETMGRYLVYFVSAVTPMLIFYSHLYVVTGDFFAANKWHTIRNHHPGFLRIFTRWYETSAFNVELHVIFNLILLAVLGYWFYILIQKFYKDKTKMGDVWLMLFLQGVFYWLVLTSNGTPDSATRYVGVNFPYFLLFVKEFGEKLKTRNLKIALGIMFLLQLVFFVLHISAIPFYSF